MYRLKIGSVEFDVPAPSEFLARITATYQLQAIRGSHNFARLFAPNGRLIAVVQKMDTSWTWTIVGGRR